jgi:hypothetical protein
MPQRPNFVVYGMVGFDMINELCDTIPFFSVDTSDSDEQMDEDEMVRPEQPGAEGMAQADYYEYVEGAEVMAGACGRCMNMYIDVQINTQIQVRVRVRI